MKIQIVGYDQFGHPFTETVDYIPPPKVAVWRRAALLIANLFPRKWNVPYKLGLSRFRNITKISVF